MIILKPIKDSNIGEWIRPFNRSYMNIISTTFLLYSQDVNPNWLDESFEMGIFNLKHNSFKNLYWTFSIRSMCEK